MNLYAFVSSIIQWIHYTVVDILLRLGLPRDAANVMNAIYDIPLVQNLLIYTGELLIILGIVVFNVVTFIWLERKILARMQDRRATMLGIRGVGKGVGWIQQIADGLKLFLKEDVMPSTGDRFCFVLCPCILVSLSIIILALIPMSSGFYVANVNGSMFLAIAIFVFAPFAIFIGGWSANSKYTLIGAMRSAAQMVASEIPLTLSIVGVVILTGSLSFMGIVEYQERHTWLILPQLLGFVLFMVAIVAELERIPFDLPEAEAELTEGWVTEYSGMKFGLIMLGEYVRGYIACAFIVLLFLGGWSGPYLPGEIWFLIKTYIVFVLLIWVRAALPRVRTDQLIAIGWRRLIPVGMFNIFVTVILAPALI